MLVKITLTKFDRHPFARAPRSVEHPSRSGFQRPQRAWAADEILQRLGSGTPIRAAVAVIVAHPDDETIGLGSRLAALHRLTLIHVTDGAPFDMEDARREGFSTREAYAQARRAECEAALACLRAAPQTRIFLGIPDKTAAERLVELTRRLAEPLAGADVVITHAYEGGHPDHDACAFAVQLACARLAQPPVRLEFAGYFGRQGHTVPSTFFPDAGSAETRVELGGPERALKAAALACYATQRGILDGFPPTHEAFRTAPDYDFSAPPPPGEVLYEAWGWSLDGRAWRDHARRARRRLAGLDARPTVLSVAFPFAPVNADPVGGAEQVLSALDRAVVQAGWRSIVIACEGSQTSGALVPIPRPPGVIDDAARRPVHAGVRAAIQRVVESEPIDLIHMHGIDFDDYLPAAGPPTLISLHLPIDWYAPSAWSSIRPNTYLLPVSRAQADTAHERLRLLPPIENGVDLANYPIVEKLNYCLAMGRIDPHKGFHLALDAAKNACAPLVLAGEIFPYARHQEYFASEIAPRLNRTRRWIGAITGERKRRVLAAARCLLVPSLAAETSSLVAREALAAGTPVVAFRTGALVDVVEEGVTGFLVDDVGQMGRAILRSSEIDPEACRRAARERFDSQAMTAAYLDLYRRLIDGEASAA